jgi:hypothetical protein
MGVTDLVHALISRLLREPLLHFLLLGALLFLAYGWLNRAGLAAPDEIVVSRSQVEGLVMQFERVWQRNPTAEEREALVESWVRDEVFYREALAMGLDQDDQVVRRRLSQKVQFILDTGSESTVPTDLELQDWLDGHADRYRIEPTYSLRQVYFDPARHGERLDAVMAAAKRALAEGREAPGDPTMLPAAIEGGAADIERTFGAEFEQALRTLPVGAWHGPVRSAFGLHLVTLEARTDARPARLEDVRPEVVRDLMQARTEAAQDALYRDLRAKYAVRIKGDSTAAASPAS